MRRPTTPAGSWVRGLGELVAITRLSVDADTDLQLSPPFTERPDARRPPACASGLVIERFIEGEIRGRRLALLPLRSVTRANFPYTWRSGASGCVGRVHNFAT